MPRFIYNSHLEPHIWCPNDEMNKLVSNALQMVAWGYIVYLQRTGLPVPDDCIRDIFVHGSTTNYYYDHTSDIDICIVMDLTQMYEMFPGVDIYKLMKSLLGSWCRNYNIKICGRGIDIEMVDYNAPKYGPNIYKVGSAYSIMNNAWIRKPVKLRRDEIRKIRRNARIQFREAKKMYRKICRNKMEYDFIETFLMRLAHERKESYAGNFLQPITAETMAFRMLRRCGILHNLRECATKQRSKNFNISIK